jgi:thiamine kinase-like enzyme
MNLVNNRELLVIDYEYAGWNPMAMDLANYLNETMLDNSYPGKNGIAWYTENCMSMAELQEMSANYLTCYFHHFMKPSVKARFGGSVSNFLQ